eukprot:TRINITY_DN61425_c0_g1_i1.p1 TRINITY_DN61425_c0_g1~~TRINITY_DN61425_c0_g1_i1.p1  ORF type:complete len:179 (+),score=7.93 TRINITY_DN61425_c0_g1_i1:76-612(+)
MLRPRLLLVVYLCVLANAISSFVGGQSWTESGLYQASGFHAEDTGFFCLCTCNETKHGTFCSGGGINGRTGGIVARFLSAWYPGDQDRGQATRGTLVAYDTATPFTDECVVNGPNNAFSYVGSRPSNGGDAFVWRGQMEGVDCNTVGKCSTLCEGEDQFEIWRAGCDQERLRPQFDIG